MTLACMLAVSDRGMQRDSRKFPILAIPDRLHQRSGYQQALPVHGTDLPLQRARRLMADTARPPPGAGRMEERATRRANRQRQLLQGGRPPWGRDRTRPRADERVPTVPHLRCRKEGCGFFVQMKEANKKANPRDYSPSKA